jgi:hypothetical protein
MIADEVDATPGHAKRATRFMAMEEEDGARDDRFELRENLLENSIFISPRSNGRVSSFQLRS